VENNKYSGRNCKWTDLYGYLEFLKGKYTVLRVKLQLFFSVRSVSVCRFRSKAVRVKCGDL
jgi:hypothetical protein